MKPVVHYDINSLEGVSSVIQTIELASDSLVVLLHDDQRIFTIEEYHWHQSEDWAQPLMTVKTLLDKKDKITQTQLLLRSRLFTLVPNSFVSSAKQKEVLELCCKESVESIVSNSLQHIKAQLVAAIPNQVKTQLFSHSPKTSQASFIDYAMALSQQKEELFLNVFSDCFELYAFRNGALQIVNIYDFKTDKDFIYQVMAVLQQLTFDASNLRCRLGGKIAPESKLHQQLKLYIKSVEFLPVRVKHNGSQAPLNHYPHLVVNTGLCE